MPTTTETTTKLREQLEPAIALAERLGFVQPLIDATSVSTTYHTVPPETLERLGPPERTHGLASGYAWAYWTVDGIEVRVHPWPVPKCEACGR